MKTPLALAIALAILGGCRLPATPTPDAGDAGKCTVIVIAGVDAGAPPGPGY